MPQSSELHAEDWVLLIDKPSGLTSFQVIEKIRRVLHIKKVGHSGTLDKFASGLLVICTGAATRLADYFQSGDKRYTGVIQLGKVTDSGDRDGAVTSEALFEGITRQQVSNALAEFIGSIEQTPPLYSAVKVNGKRASDKMRRGEEFDLKARTVQVYSIDLTDFDETLGRATVDVHCSKGTYIRSIAYDLGQKLGCGAHLAELRRTASGGFCVEQAASEDAFGTLTEPECPYKLKPAAALNWLDIMGLDPSGTAKALNGTAFLREEVDYTEKKGVLPYLILDDKKNLIAIADIDIDTWKITYQNVFNV